MAFLLACSPLRAEADGTRGSELQLTDLAIPDTLGTIDSRFAGTSDHWVILIQDIHAHLTAQENISAIVDHLNSLYGIETFGIEGGWSKTKLFASNKLPQSKAKQMLARSLLEEEYITGPAYSGLFSPKPLKLIGIEDRELYMKNREVFLSHMAGREQAEQELDVLEKEMLALKTLLYGRDLAEFDKGLTAYRAGIKAEEFLPALIAAAENSAADLSDLDQVQHFQDIMAAAAALTREKLASEAKRLENLFGNSGRLNFEEILRSGKVPDEQLARYPEALKFKNALALSDALSHHAFGAQVDEAIERVKAKLIATPEEKDLDLRSERLQLAKKIILLRAVPADLTRAAKYKTEMQKDIGETGLSEAFKAGVSFYRLAKKRDSMFFKSITSQPLLAGNIAVVAGGFHTEGLTARLEKRNISYMIITPSLGKEPVPPDEALYFKRMAQDAAGRQTLSHIQNRFLLGSFDKGFVAGVGTLKETNNILKAVQTLLTAVAAGGVESAGGSKPSPALTSASFLAMQPARQKQMLEKWLEDFKSSKMPIVIAIRTSSLLELLKDPAGKAFWKSWVAPDKLTTVGELKDSDEYIDELLGMKAAVVRLKTETSDDIGILIEKKFLSGEIKKNVALIDADYKTDKFLTLPESPASLMLARLLLEGKFSGGITEELLGKVSALLTEIFEAQGLLEQSA